MKLAILFPGIGYHTDKPLLYYSKKILKNMNYEIKEIHFENLDFDLNKSKDEAYKQAKDQIHKFDLKAYDSILFISKSIGTYCAAKLAHEYKLTANIYFTPLDFTLEYLILELKISGLTSIRLNIIVFIILLNFIVLLMEIIPWKQEIFKQILRI